MRQPVATLAENERLAFGVLTLRVHVAWEAMILCDESGSSCGLGHRRKRLDVRVERCVMLEGTAGKNRD